MKFGYSLAIDALARRRSFAGLRVMLEDGHPIMSEVEGIEAYMWPLCMKGIALSLLAGHL